MFNYQFKNDIMCKCLPNQQFCLRSSSAVSFEDQDLINFKNSADYKAYLKNFETVPQFDFARLLTFNNTTRQAIFIPITQSTKEKTVIVTYFDLLRKNFFTLVISSKGDLDNMVELSGELNIHGVSKELLFKGSFNDNKFININPPITPIPNEAPVKDCITKTVQEIGNNGTAAIICMLFPEECVVAILLHCALESLT